MSKDTIYRQDAMNAFDCSIGGVPVESVKYVSEYADKMMSRINALPSAKPERKTGKWIKCDEDKWAYGALRCSECGGGYHLPNELTVISWRFCPNCGARMEGQDGER